MYKELKSGFAHVLIYIYIIYMTHIYVKCTKYIL